jgi:hypothetical protein
MRSSRSGAGCKDVTKGEGGEPAVDQSGGDGDGAGYAVEEKNVGADDTQNKFVGSAFGTKRRQVSQSARG